MAGYVKKSFNNDFQMGFDLLSSEFEILPPMLAGDLDLFSVELPIEKTALERAKLNIKAIELLNKLGNQPATAKQQALLAKFTGWGFPEIRRALFDSSAKGPWLTAQNKLKSYLSCEEYRIACQTTQYAHYTPKEIASAMWSIVKKLGVKQGLCLEAGAGTGHFKGYQPNELKLDYEAVELDPITSRIATKNYPTLDLQTANFLSMGIPAHRYDLVIGNPPYANINASGKYQGFKVHDAFISQSLDSLKDGGIGVFVVSTGTLDKIDQKARNYINKRSSLLAAYRLPNSAFNSVAGTKVITDILVFQRTKRGNYDSFVSSVPHDDTEKNSLCINNYFKENPDNILGTLKIDSNQWGECFDVKDTLDWKSSLEDKIKELPEVFKNSTWDTIKSRKSIYELNPGLPEDYFYEDSEGNVRQVVGGLGYKLQLKGSGNYYGLSKKENALIKDYIPLRNAVLAVYEKQLAHRDSTKEQALMSNLYDVFVQAWGPINQEKYSTASNGQSRYSEPVLKVIERDSEAYRVAAIEDYDSTTQTASKGDIFTEVVINIEQGELEAKSADDALKISMNRLGCVDLDFMSGLYSNTPKSMIIEELGDLIYFDPSQNDYVLAEEYLSGDIKSKLEFVQEQAKTSPNLMVNVQGLEAKLPKDIPFSNIPIRLGQTWIPLEVYQDFAKSKVDLDGSVTRYIKDSITAWNVAGECPDNHCFSTSRKSAGVILHAALNQKTITVRDKVIEDGKEIYVVNESETAAANDKIKEVQNCFVDYVNADHDLCIKLNEIYNNKFNRVVPRCYNGEFLEFPGLSRKFKPRSFQRNSVWRTIVTGNVYYAHLVGAGKTSTSILAMMEMKRLGLIQKPCAVVTKPTLKQWAAEIYRMYPSSRVLIMDSKKLDKKNRKKYMAKLATGNWDAVVMTHQVFTRISMSEYHIKGCIGDMVSELEETLENVDQSDRTTIMQLNRQIEMLTNKQESLLSQHKKDGGITFEESGIDGIFYDEAQSAKKCGAITNQGNLKGVDTSASAIGIDLKLKFDYLKNEKEFSARVQMSATPCSNSLVEIRTLMMYFIQDTMFDLDLGNFDSWMSEFASSVTELEMQPSGGFKAVTRVMEFSGISALGRLLSSFMDFVTQDILDSEKEVTRPLVTTGDRQIKAIERSKELAKYQTVLQRRLDKISERKGPPKKGDDIVPCVITDGRKASIDMRLVGLPQTTQSKLDAVIEHAANKYHCYANDVYFNKGQPELIKGSTQIIFCDLIESNNFNVFKHIRNELINRYNCKPDEIAIANDFATDVKKRQLYQKMNSGKIRVLIGSSFSCGTGVNVQRRLKTLTHIDINWTPHLIIQREGRGVRQGNLNSEVEIYAFVTTSTTDSMMWHLNSAKQRMIESIFKPFDEDELLKITSISDIESTNASQMALAKAIASGKPEVMEQAGLENEIAKLEKLQYAHKNQKFKAKQDLPWMKEQLESYKTQVSILGNISKSYISTKGDNFKVIIGNQVFDRRQSASDALMESIILNNGKRKEQILGVISGYKLIGKFNSLKQENALYIQFGSLLDPICMYSEINPSGIIRKIENAASGVFDRLDESERHLKRLERNIKANELLLGNEWPFKAELVDKIKRLDELNDLLSAA